MNHAFRQTTPLKRGHFRWPVYKHSSRRSESLALFCPLVHQASLGTKFILQESFYDNKNLSFQILTVTFVKAIEIVCIIDLTDSVCLLRMATEGTLIFSGPMHTEGETNNDLPAIPQARDWLCVLPFWVSGKRLCSCGESTARDRSVPRGQ